MKSLDGPWYVPILQIDSNRSIEIIEPNIGVAKIQDVPPHQGPLNKYGTNTMHGKYKNIQNYSLLDFETMLPSSFDGM